jgi:hypothetical protein
MKSKKNNPKIKYGNVDIPDDAFDPKHTKIKITSWFDADIILELQDRAEREGIKYQTYMNMTLRKAVLNTPSLEKRVENIEKILKIKKN